VTTRFEWGCRTKLAFLFRLCVSQIQYLWKPCHWIRSFRLQHEKVALVLDRNRKISGLITWVLNTSMVQQQGSRRYCFPPPTLWHLMNSIINGALPFQWLGGAGYHQDLYFQNDCKSRARLKSFHFLLSHFGNTKSAHAVRKYLETAREEKSVRSTKSREFLDVNENSIWAKETTDWSVTWQREAMKLLLERWHLIEMIFLVFVKTRYVIEIANNWLKLLLSYCCSSEIQKGHVKLEHITFAQFLFQVWQLLLRTNNVCMFSRKAF